MQSKDLKLFAIFYIKEDEILSDKDKVQLMDFVESSDDKNVLFLLATGQMPGERFLSIKESGNAFQIQEFTATGHIVQTTVDAIVGGAHIKDLAKSAFYAGKMGFQGYKTYKHVKDPVAKERKIDASTMYLAGAAASALAASVALKVGKKGLAKMQPQCDKEKGQARKVCYNKIKRDAIRMEILSLSSMKIKCRKTKNPETCIKNMDKRIKELQDRMDSIKVF
jgi:hypothetical protein